VGAVERGDAHGGALLEGSDLRAVRHDLRTRRAVGEPARLGDGGVRFGGDVEPHPAAVLEVGQRNGEFRHIVSNQVPGDRHAGAVDLGAVHLDAGGAGHIHAQEHVLQLRPAAPVAGGESVEVGLEGGLRTRGNGHGDPITPGQPLLVLLRLNKVEHPYIVRFALPGQQDSLQHLAHVVVSVVLHFWWLHLSSHLRN
jgi:hypothetical protein